MRMREVVRERGERKRTRDRRIRRTKRSGVSGDIAIRTMRENEESCGCWL